MVQVGAGNPPHVSQPRQRLVDHSEDRYAQSDRDEDAREDEDHATATASRRRDRRLARLGRASRTQCRGHFVVLGYASWIVPRSAESPRESATVLVTDVLP